MDKGGVKAERGYPGPTLNESNELSSNNLRFFRNDLGLVFHTTYSCISHSCYLLLLFPLLHFPPVRSTPAISTPAFSALAILTVSHFLLPHFQSPHLNPIHTSNNVEATSDFVEATFDRPCRKDDILTQKSFDIVAVWQQSRTLLRHCIWCGRGFTEHGAYA